MNKHIIFLIFIFFGFSFAFSSEAALTCSITTGSCAGTTVLKMSSTTNAHAELPTQTNYNYYLCCSGVAGLSNSCSGIYDIVLKLSSTTNAHVEQENYTNYPNNTCLSVPSGPFQCDYAADCLDLPPGYTCLASISDPTNAHIGDCNAHPIKVCCSTSAVPITYKYNVFGWAWSENIGWVSMNCVNGGYDEGTNTYYNVCPTSDYGVDISTTTGIFSGSAWSENIGWISFNSADLVGCPPTVPPAPCDAHLYYPTKEVIGWAKALSAAGNGWDGWIRLGTSTSPLYRVWIATTTPPEFRGWAWGEEVIGWLSFNCLDGGFNEMTSTTFSVCPTSNYKVTTTAEVISAPPDKPTTTPPLYPEGETWNNCSIQELSIPTFHWTYSDPDGDPQSAFQLRIDNSATFFDETCGTGASNEFCISGGAVTETSPDTSNWGVWMDWNIPYNWIVRVRDAVGKWSPWSDPNPFTTPLHAFPWPKFAAIPQNPSAGEVVDFIQNTPIPLGPSTSSAICYDGGSYLCQSGTTPPISYIWDFSYDGITLNTESTTKGNTSTTYPTAGQYTVRLRITDTTLGATNNFCPDTLSSPLDVAINVSRRLPQWKEIPPFIWLPPFPSLADIQKPLAFALENIAGGLKKILVLFNGFSL